MNNNELCVSAGALAMEGEDGAGVAPGVGDEVEFTTKGKVSRIEGGQVYVMPTEVNGQPVGGADAPESGADEDLAGEGAALDEEVNQMQGGMGALLVLLLLLLGLGTASAKDVEFSRNSTFSGTAVSNWVAVAFPTQGFSVEVNNFTGATLYLLVFDSATNQLVNATPHFTALPVPTGTVGYKDWNAAGAPFRYGVNVCLSTTPFSLTNASGGGSVTVIHSAVNQN